MECRTRADYNLRYFHCAEKMSEGWLTESALLPSRPKDISGVNQKSLKPLQVLVAEKNRAETTLLVNSPTRVAQITREPRRSRKRTAKLDPLSQPGKSSRTEQIDTNQNNLQKKASLYEALRAGRISEDEVLQTLRQSNSRNSTEKIRKEDLLVDFSVLTQEEVSAKNPNTEEEPVVSKPLSRIQLLRNKRGSGDNI